PEYPSTPSRTTSGTSTPTSSVRRTLARRGNGVPTGVTGGEPFLYMCHKVPLSGGLRQGGTTRRHLSDATCRNRVNRYNRGIYDARQLVGCGSAPVVERLVPTSTASDRFNKGARRRAGVSPLPAHPEEA